MQSNKQWWTFLAATIAVGIASRMTHTGWVLADKYLGDALYAAMVYALIRLASRAPRWQVAAAAMTLMTAIECFQLTLLPAQLAASRSLPLHILGRLLGTQFSWNDLAAYAIGILAVFCIDRTPSGYDGVRSGGSLETKH